MGAASVLPLAWRAGIGGPRAVTRILLSGTLRIGPVNRGSEARCALSLRGLTTMAATVASAPMAVVVVGDGGDDGDHGAIARRGPVSRGMRGADVRGRDAKEWDVSKR